MRTTELLIIESAPSSAELLAHALTGQGYRVRIAATCAEAIAACKAYPPDLAILCNEHTSANQLDIAQTLRRDFSIAFLFCSGDNDKEMINRAATEGAIGYLPYPLDANSAMPTIEIALARARDLRAAAELLDRLAEGMKSKREIDIAIGLILERFSLSQEHAQEVLRRMARSTNRKLIDTAVELLESSERMANANRLAIELINNKR